MHYVISPTGLVHAIDCPRVTGIAFSRVHALRMGKRLAKCCAGDRVTPQGTPWFTVDVPDR